MTGEESGDLYGAHLIRSIRRRNGDISFWGIGGNYLEEAGMELIQHYRDISVVGFSEVVRMIPRIWRILNRTERMVRDRRPDLVILIDNPGFNIRLGARIKGSGTGILYYISPQVWAWHEKRKHKIAQIADHLVVILPFEPEVYSETGLPVTYVGHPLMDIVRSDSAKEEFCTRHGLNRSEKIIGMFPGSRKHEAERLLPVFVQTARRLRKDDAGLQCVISMARTLPRSLFDHYLDGEQGLTLLPVDRYDLMAHADFLILASGTVTLEAAIIGTPMIIVYKLSAFSYHLAKRLAAVSHFGLVNIVAGDEIVPELMQHEVTPERLQREVQVLLKDAGRYAEAGESLQKVVSLLGEPGASGRAAEIVLRMTKKD